MSRGIDWTVAAGSAVCAALLAAWLAAGGWLEPAAVRDAATTSMAWHVPGFALDQLGRVYPHLWLLLQLALDVVGREPATIARAVIAAGAVGISTALWYDLLRRHGWSARWALLLVGLCLAHPFSLWVVSRGGQDSMGLLAATLLVVVLCRLSRGVEPRHVVILALVLGLGLLLDPRWAFYAPLVIALLPLLVGRAWLAEAAPALLIVACLPLAGVLLFLVSVGWIFDGRPLAFLLEAGGPTARPDEAIDGPAASVAQAALWLLAATLAGAPVLGVALRRRRGRRAALLLLAGGLPAAGLAAALFSGAAWDGSDFLHVATAASVAAVALLGRSVRPPSVSALVLLGHLGGWLVLTPLGSERIDTWWAGLLHAPAAQPFAAELALAAFLAGGPTTLIDDRHGFPVVAALGAAHPLVLPPSPTFAGQLLQPVPTVAQIAVPRPAQATRDRILQRHPDLWVDGLAGYRLVYDHAEWRVWRRVEARSMEATELRRCTKEPPHLGRLEETRRRSKPPRATGCPQRGDRGSET